jgi:hypothetical protein
MALSPNYGFPEPDNSSLVKNGAQDIRALGDAVDTAIWNVGFGQAAKNKILNSDFSIWQRGTSFSNPASASYLADRYVFFSGGSGVTRTISRQAFTAGTAPVAGYEGKYFFRFDQSVAGTGDSFNQMQQKIEDVQTFAGQTVTFSFWAKAAATTVLPRVRVSQNFGSGGSADVNVDFATSVSITTGWTRYSYTAAIPSISGKTIGTGSSLVASIWLPINATFTFDTWGWQIEYGSKATPFQTASGGSPQAELAMCQRYYVRLGGGSAYDTLAVGFAVSTSTMSGFTKLPTTMRTAPTSIDFSTLATYDGTTITGTPDSVSLVTAETGKDYAKVSFAKTSSFTQYRPYSIITNNSTSGYLGFSAEL